MDWERLFNRREDYKAEVPNGVLLLTAGIDVQDNRIELEIVGDYFEGDKETRDYPGSSSYFEASQILHAGENIFEFFSWDDISKMEELVIEKLEE